MSSITAIVNADYFSAGVMPFMTSNTAILQVSCCYCLMISLDIDDVELRWVR